jgi:hypothetical protein
MTYYHATNLKTIGARLPRAALIALTLNVAADRLIFGQEPAAGAADKRNAQFIEMKQIAGSLAVFQGEGSLKHPVKLRGEPLLRWNDPIRDTSNSSLWAWGETGRPLAVVALETSQDDPGGRLAWSFELISLAPESLKFHEEHGINASIATTNPLVNGSFVWAPEKPGVRFRDIPDAPLPAQTPRLRLGQIRELIKRFAATEHVTRQPDLLRLMPHPIDRYADPAKEQVDGAIFLFAHGTNPEVIVLIEAQGSAPEKATWRFAVARLTVAPFEVTIDRKVVETVPYHSGRMNRPSLPYFVLRLPGK